MGGIVVTASDVKGAADTVEANAQALDLVFAKCTALDAATKTQWAGWFKGWRAWFVDHGDPYYFELGLPALGDQVVGYEHELADWQGVASKLGCGQGPIHKPSENPPGTPSTWEGTIKTVAIAASVIAGVVGVGYLVRPFLPEPKGE